MEQTPAQKNAPMIKDVSEIRVEVQKLIDRVKNKYNSREASLVLTKLQESRHWLGELKGSLGAELPSEYLDK
jgi:hypothetical protein